jgi:integrase
MGVAAIGPSSVHTRSGQLRKAAQVKQSRTGDAVRDAKGGAYEKRGRFFARVTVAPQKRPAVLLSWCTDLGHARTRAHALQAMVTDLRLAGELTWIEKVLEVGAPADATELASLERWVAAIVEGKIERIDPGEKKGPETFETFATKWTKGELHTSYPDDIKEKTTQRTDALRLAKLYETIGGIPLARFTLQDAQRAMRALPEGLSANTRRQYAQLIHRVLVMAVYPVCLIPHSPLPRGFLPKPGKEKAKALPWPSEDATGLACEAWPLAHRMFFGFLPREGMRTGEAAALTWGDLSLDVGAVRLDENKTDEPRAWALDPAVATALRLWKGMRKDTKKRDLVFKQPDGQPYNTDKLAALYREYLERACGARPEILKDGPNRMRARAHDMRGMFVTYSLANGRTESWVQDRTGHTTSIMVNRYRQSARTVAELGLGKLAPLVTAIPELAAAYEREKDAAAERGGTPREESSPSVNVALLGPKAASASDQAEFRFHRREA